MFKLKKQEGGTLDKCLNRNYQDILNKLTQGDLNIKIIEKSPHKRYFKLGIFSNHSDNSVYCGKGSFKTVYLAIDNTKKKLVVWCEINVKNISQNQKKNIVREINILEKINSKYISRLLGSSFSRESGKVSIWLDYAKLGDIKDLIMTYKQKNSYLEKRLIINYLYRTLKALSYIHQLEIIHCDIKPENILLYKNKYDSKLADFGLAISKLGYETQGTPAFMAPEMFARQEQDPPYSSKVDIYSMGYLLVNLVSLDINNSSFRKNISIYRLYKKILNTKNDPTSLKNEIIEKELIYISDYINDFSKYDSITDDTIFVDTKEITWNTKYKFIDFFIDCVGYPRDRLSSNQLLDKYFYQR